GGDEPLLLEPVARLRREQEELLEPDAARLGFDLAHQRRAVGDRAVAIARMHRQAGELARAGAVEWIECTTTDDDAVELGDEETIDFLLELRARALDQRAGGLERPDQLDDAGDVLDRRAADVLRT